MLSLQEVALQESVLSLFNKALQNDMCELGYCFALQPTTRNNIIVHE